MFRATNLIGETYKEVWPTPVQSKPALFCGFAKKVQPVDVPYALPTPNHYVVLVRSKKEIEELDKIPEQHVSFHTAMSDVSISVLSATSQDLTCEIAYLPSVYYARIQI